MEINLLFITTESLLCSLLIHLSYRVWKLMMMLKQNGSCYKFGSVSWWHWMEHLSAGLLFFIGSIGMTWVNIAKIVDHLTHVNPTFSSISNLFTSFVVVGGIILINHMIKEETPESDMYHGERK